MPLRVEQRGSATSAQAPPVIQMQRRRLLLAFGEIVGEEGLAGASVGRICARARVSRRTFYDLFEDREGCFLAAFEQALGQISKSAIAAHEGKRAWGDRVRAGLTAVLESFDESPGLARMCVVETLRGGTAVGERRQRVLDMLAATIEQGGSRSGRAAVRSPIGAQAVVGGAVAVVHARVLEPRQRPLADLVNPLMAMIVHPYLGAAAARRELERPESAARPISAEDPVDPFKGLSIRITYRTACVLAAIASSPGASNRLIAGPSGISDEGQMSRLLIRLQRSGLIDNRCGDGGGKGAANAWSLTERGEAVYDALGARLG